MNSINVIDQYPDNFVDVGIDEYGLIYHKDAKGEYHNPYGPAVIRSDGYKAYYVHGKLHRTDGPAVIWPDGGKAYWIHGKLHRTDGPAVIWSNGSTAYWVNDKKLTEEEFNRLYSKNNCSAT